MLKPIIMVGLGGSIGAVSRYLTSLYITKFTGNGFPWATLGVNLVGCLLIGIITGIILDKEFSWPVREFLIIGILGGFTTFSAFGMETINLIRSGSMGAAAGYVSISLLAGVVFAGVGILLSREFISM